MPRFNEVHTDHFLCDRRNTISLEENKKRYIAYNVAGKSVAQYHIDKNNEPPKKCDYAIYVDEDDRIIFIELKGSDVLHAIKQIRQSINDKVILPRITCSTLDARIIASKTPNPNFTSSAEVKLNQILKSYGGKNLKISTRYYKENI